MNVPRASLDQADGLRRLVGRHRPRVLWFASSGERVGRTTLAVNLAAALALQGRNVVMLDENRGAGNVCAGFGLRARYELAHALHGDRPLRDAVLHPARGIAVLPAATGLGMLGAPMPGNAALGALQTLLAGAHFVLIDTSASRAAEDALPVLGRSEVIITTLASASAITRAYAWIKRLASHSGDMEMSVVVCRSKDDDEARVVFGNLSAVSERHLGVRLAFLGQFGDDAQIGDAAGKGRTVVEAYPRSRAAAQLRSLAAQLRVQRRDEHRGAAARPSDSCRSASVAAAV